MYKTIIRRIDMLALVVLLSVFPAACYMPTHDNAVKPSDSVSAEASSIGARLSFYTYLAATKLKSGEISVDYAKLCRSREQGLRANLESAIDDNYLFGIDDVSRRLNNYTDELEAK